MCLLAIRVALCLVLILSFSYRGNALSLNYYDQTCPNVESIITAAMTNAVAKDKTVPAALLRMHFHDCFIRVNSVVLFNSIMCCCC